MINKSSKFGVYYNNIWIMLGNPKGKFEILVTKLLAGKQYEVALIEGLKLYQIKQYHVTDLVPNKIVQMFYLITTKFYYNRQPGDSESWYQNQLRVFIWLLVGYAFIQNKHISELGDSDWHYFSQIFNFRNPDIFEFQSKTIIKKSIKCTRWDREQVDLLDSLIKSKSIKNKWNEIAKQLFIISEKKYFRTAKQCRQHWINHLNPNTVRASWTALQDLQLVETILKHGKKWSKVSKILGGKRTEHMVKNRFKSLFHFEAKRYERKMLENKQVQNQVIHSMIFKLKCNIQEGNKLSQIRENKLEMLKVESCDEDNDKIYEEQNDYDMDLSEVIGERNILQREEEQDSLRKTFQNLRKIDEDHVQNTLQNKLPQFLQEDCINMFFHDSYIFPR